MSTDHKEELLRIGRRLKELRDEKGLRLQDLAPHAGVTFQHLAKVENGEPPSIETLIDLVTVGLRITLGEFFYPWLPKLTPDEKTAIEFLRRAVKSPDGRQAVLDGVAMAKNRMRHAAVKPQSRPQQSKQRK